MTVFNLMSLVITIPLFFSCGRDKPKSPYKARIVASTGSGYKLTTVQFKTLVNVERMEGDLAYIRGNAVVNALAEDSDIIDPTSRDSVYLEPGKTIKLDYIVKGDVIYPKNFDSMSLLAIYYNYENTFKYWEENLGLSLDDFGRMRILYAPKVRVQSRGSFMEGTLKVNAAFVPGLRHFWFFKTSRLEDVPICMNFGVLAHEFGHATFDLYFAKKDPLAYQTDNALSSDLLSGINEGLADFFSFAVTGNNKEFSASMQSIGDQRKLPVSFKYSELGKIEDCLANYYCKGSILASSLYEISQLDGQSAAKVANVAKNSLDKFRGDWDKEKESLDFDFHYFLKRLVETADEADKATYCEYFKKWFDVDSIRNNIGCS